MENTAQMNITLYLSDKYFSYIISINKMLSYHRETALQGTLVLARSGRLELGDNILRTL